MLELFRSTAFECSQLVTERYSTSFTLGIKTLDKSLQKAIFGIYGYVRQADEIVDTLHDYDKEALLAEFREETWRAIDRGISTNPIIQCFQQVVNDYRIDHHLVEAFLDSMEKDLLEVTYEQDGYEEYIYGSAEVVGLMCLKVFVDGDEDMYHRLKAPARSLGAAFQKVNFLRDMRSDFEERGRVYFPGVDFVEFNDPVKKQLEADIQQDFDDAYDGIVQLPDKAKLGVFLAYRYYKSLFKRIKNASASRIQEARLRVPDQTKLMILAGSVLRSYVRLI